MEGYLYIEVLIKLKANKANKKIVSVGKTYLVEIDM